MKRFIVPQNYIKALVLIFIVTFTIPFLSLTSEKNALLFLSPIFLIVYFYFGMTLSIVTLIGITFISEIVLNLNNFTNLNFGNFHIAQMLLFLSMNFFVLYLIHKTMK